jgi:hypothetical protein
MSFNIFASGVANGQTFHFYRENCIDGDDFNIADLISTLQGMNQNVIGVAQAAAESVISKMISGSAADAMGTVAFLEFLHVLKDQIDSLAMCDDAANGRIIVYTKKWHLIQDTYGTGQYLFPKSIDPGTEFVRAIGPALEATEMNNWGVLRAMVIVLTLYSNAVGQSGKPMLMIQLDK